MPIEEDVIVGTIPKNNREDIRVTLSNFKGHDLVGARIWFKSKEGEPRPSSKGITVNVKVLPELIGLLEDAEKIQRAIFPHSSWFVAVQLKVLSQEAKALIRN